MGNISPTHNSNSQHRNPTFYYIGTLDPLGSVGGVCVVIASPVLESANYNGVSKFRDKAL